VGSGHELIQGRLAKDGIEGEVDLRNVEDDALRAVVLRGWFIIGGARILVYSS
jgi:hypothetical protein